MTAGSSKAELVEAIAVALGVATPHMSTGSTEPKEILLIANNVLGLGLSADLTKPELARGIVESAGFPWSPTAESRGGTVTAEGLACVLRAVLFFTV